MGRSRERNGEISRGGVVATGAWAKVCMEQQNGWTALGLVRPEGFRSTLCPYNAEGRAGRSQRGPWLSQPPPEKTLRAVRGREKGLCAWASPRVAARRRSYPRTIGHKARIDYRHLIASLVRKPGAFAGYIYREELFPRLSFRQAYHQLERADEPQADRHYLGLHALAAERGEDEVAAALGVVLREAGVPWRHAVAAALGSRNVAPPMLASFTPELHSYDALIAEVSARAPGEVWPDRCVRFCS